MRSTNKHTVEELEIYIQMYISSRYLLLEPIQRLFLLSFCLLGYNEHTLN